MKTLSAWFERLSDRTVNALFIAFAIICISVFLTGVASYLSARARLPPYEYVFQTGDEAVSTAAGVVTLPTRTLCPGETFELPGYTLNINRAPVRVSLVSTWRDAVSNRTVIPAGDDEIAYFNYPREGIIRVDGMEVTVPRGLEPGQYERVTTASTPTTFPEAYVTPIVVRACG